MYIYTPLISIFAHSDDGRIRVLTFFSNQSNSKITNEGTV